MSAPVQQPAAAPEPSAPEEPPPVLGSWRNVYALVIGALLACVVLLYALARWAA